MIKRTSLDDVFSQCVRESADWTCQRCGLEFPDRKSRNCHASHFISRKFHSVRWYPNNVFCLCGKCHSDVSDNPAEHTKLAFRILGEGAFELLQERKRRIVRYRAADKREMAAHYRDELDLMLAQRRNGVIGQLSFSAYD